MTRTHFVPARLGRALGLAAMGATLAIASAQVHAYSVYIPEVRANWNGWSTSIYVMNVGTATANISANFYDSAGALSPLHVPQQLAVNGRTFIGLTANDKPGGPGAWVASGVINSDQPVVVLVALVGETTRYAYAMYEGVDASKTTAAPAVPLVMKGSDGFNTRLRIQNTGTATASFWIGFYRDQSSAAAVYAENVTLGVNRVKQYAVGGVAGIPAGFRGTAVILPSTSPGQPLAVTAVHEKGAAAGNDGLMATSHSLATSAGRVYAPLMHKSNYGWDSSVIVQNTSAAASTFTFSQYSQSGTLYQNISVPARSSETIDPTDALWPYLYSGYFAMDAANGAAKSGVVRQYVPGTKIVGANSMVATASKTVVLPYFNTKDSNFESGFSIHNTANASNTVTIRYYNGAPSPGAAVATKTLTIGALKQGIVHQYDMPANVHGVAIISGATYPVVVTVNTTHHAAVNDGLFAYTGFPR